MKRYKLTEKGFALAVATYPIAMLMWFTPLDKYMGIVMGIGLLSLVMF